jgi:ABC-2 type transport system permease protein
MAEANAAISRALPSPLALLIRVNLSSMWRRLLSLKGQSRLLTTVICLFVPGYLVLAFWLFFKGLKFVYRFPGMGTLLMERLLFLLFAFLFVLLLLSNIVIGYSNLFRNRETAFLLTLPVSRETVFRWKFIESTLLASWAFLFLIAPLLAAYGLNQKVPWHFYFITPVLVGLFIVLPGVAGSFVAINVARYLDRRLFQVVALCLMLALVCSAAIWLKPEVPDNGSETRVYDVLDRLLSRTNFAQYPLLPSYWLSSSVLQWADGAVLEAGFFILVLLSHVLFFGVISFTRWGSLFYEASSAVQSRASVFGRWEWSRRLYARQTQKAASKGRLERLVDLLPGLRPDVRALIVKDTRMFWRDTSQWAQSIVLFGLLGVYIFNLRHYSQQLTNPFWLHLVSYLNLGACSLNLATLTTRFVFPQFSLEGKRIWIVGLAPIGLVRIIRTKYWLSTCTSLVVTMGLITLSCYMLKMGFGRTFLFMIAIGTMTLTLNGLAVGLGVLYPNFKEENPSKIVSGFGGTFCLVLSFLYILGSVVLLAVAAPGSAIATLLPWQTAACLAGFVTLSVGLGWIPMHLALRRVKDIEV